MADTKTYNKIIYAGKTLIDLTADTIAPDKLASGITAHDKSGAVIEGTSTFDSDTSADTASADEILNGRTAHVKGAEVTGTMPNNGSVSGTISNRDDEYTIPAGYHDGGGKITISETERAKIIPSNIRDGVEILGTTGTMTGTESVKAESRSVVPKSAEQTVTPADGYNYLSQVTIFAIPYVETENNSGGTTVTIG